MVTAGEQLWGFTAMKCPWCNGRGFTWVGTPDNADRGLCGPCRGSGQGRLDWTAVGGLVLVLLSGGVMLWFIYYVTTKGANGI